LNNYLTQIQENSNRKIIQDMYFASEVNQRRMNFINVMKKIYVPKSQSFGVFYLSFQKRTELNDIFINVRPFSGEYVDSPPTKKTIKGRVPKYFNTRSRD
jgi:hypothetical protein